MQGNLPGIDLARGLANVRGNARLYEKLLHKFYEQYRNTSIELGQLIAAGAYADAKRLTHSVKGVAGSLGAYQLYEACYQLEQALEAADPAVLTIQVHFINALQEVLEGLRQ